MLFDLDMIKKVYASMPERVDAARKLVGNPIELRVNSTLDYAKVTIKAGTLFGGYKPFNADQSGNIAYSPSRSLISRPKIGHFGCERFIIFERLFFTLGICKVILPTL